jgi:dTDP-4-dehydrorhamnose 3,5-epimerase
MDQRIIEGVRLNSLKEIKSEKGSVLHMLRSDDLDFENFGECYFSEVFMGCIKGWKKHLIQTQNLSVPVGLIKFVLYDDRLESSTYKELNTYILGRPTDYFRLTIPNGIFYSFKNISNQNSLIVNCVDIPHDSKESIIKEINSKEIPYKW